MSESGLAKIAISIKADEELSRSLEKVNAGFLGGKITKTDLASWYLNQATTHLDAGKIEEVRTAHFNQLVYLESLVKKLKAEGKDNLGADEITALQFILTQQTVKKQVKNKRQGPPNTPEDSQITLD